ncbi:4958_t:CDS:2 [Funneliformis mosseae]|uniref:4958_t:CDS:1 n=1 Tax=Funneliformis mosseae TaxID=27381 RepID=A0A9N9B0U0_FUNMO|nr:4958_t:CDS:2 [Funneliformis mosseae]
MITFLEDFESDDMANAEELNVIPTQLFIASLTEMVYKQAETFAINLENFANHANRSTISMDDVKLCSRRNDELKTYISNFANSILEHRALRPSRQQDSQNVENSTD